METKKPELVFEISWEVCNKVGGVHTVLKTKASSATGEFGDGYYLVGPDLRANADFEETEEECWAPLKEAMAARDLACRFGRWRVPGDPKVILVNYAKKFNADQICYRMWEDFGVDSLKGGQDYKEMVLFGWSCAEAVEAARLALAKPGAAVVAHFHEWLSASGLLKLKKSAPSVGTVFTAHATALGRALAAKGVDIYNKIDQVRPLADADALGLSAPHSLESTAAGEADCFTTVSEITAREAKDILGAEVDLVLPNGLDVSRVPDYSVDRMRPEQCRQRLLDFAAKFLGRPLPGDTKMFVISGLYQYHNKGIDVFLEALGRLDRELAKGQSVLAFIFVLANHKGINPGAMRDGGKAMGRAPIATHKLANETTDIILDACERLRLSNSPANHVSVIFMPAYLDGYDGLINISYDEVLAACDLGVFPSFYEPWGYTPLESMASAVPTVTTNFAGFGMWLKNNAAEPSGAVVLDRCGKDVGQIAAELAAFMRKYVAMPPGEVAAMRAQARRTAVKATWTSFYQYYIAAYGEAISAAAERAAAMAAEAGGSAFVYSGMSTFHPHLRSLTAVSDLPREVKRLRELAYNLWWAWNPDALELFSQLDPSLWPQMSGNPVRMLETVSQARLRAAARNDAYLALYHDVLARFDAYMAARGPQGLALAAVSRDAPAAYFSAEYGLAECLPIYSGGLGVLSGDTLKSASDLNVPLVAVGLLYKNGYFRQRVDKDGWQVALYPENDFSSLPAQPVRDEKGEEVFVSVELPGRELHARVWRVNVGRVPLYLLDTDTQKNTEHDRKVTSALYNANPNTRVEQEILLGMGGVRALRRLGIHPSVFHMNEGHSAFLLLERVGVLMREAKLSFEAACEAVRSSSVFTTHTPVEAGNERFPRALMESYFANFVAGHGLSWSQFWELGRKDAGDDQPFYMTILALKLSNMANGVSRMHGSVSRSMWKDLYKGFLASDVPIGHVTNGVHMATFAAPAMRELLNSHIGLDWQERQDDPERWKPIHSVPDAILWRVKCQLKRDLLALLAEKIAAQRAMPGACSSWREEIISRVNPAALTIGFARRFATYKRSTLLFTDPDRLARILSNPKHPVQVIFSGKAHPSDRPGQELIKRIVEMCACDERFRGRVFFIEDYDMRIARHLVQGVDVWLNTPRRPYEASGTSGMKVIVNGGLNLSVSDGWWCEGYNGANGWNIGPVASEFSQELIDSGSDAEDADSLYHLLEESVVPLYYDRDDAGLPRRWLQMVKASFASLMPVFNTHRMVKEYFAAMFEPTAARGARMAADGYKLCSEAALWKMKIPMRFSSLKILDVGIKGVDGDQVATGSEFSVFIRVEPGKLAPEEILAEFVIGKTDGAKFLGKPESVPLKLVERGRKSLLFAGSHKVSENGQYSYGIRVWPVCGSLAAKEDAGMAVWA